MIDEDKRSYLRQIRSDELHLLSDRFSFLIAGTAFLVTGFATLVGPGKALDSDGGQLLFLSHAICAIGYYLAFLFLFVNFVNTLTVSSVGHYLNEPEKEEYREIHRVRSIINYELPKNTFELVCRIGKDLWSLAGNPIEHSKEKALAYTWLVPLGLCIFWLVLWLCVLPDWWIPLSFVAGLPILYLIFLGVLWLFKYLKPHKGTTPTGGGEPPLGQGPTSENSPVINCQDCGTELLYLRMQDVQTVVQRERITNSRQKL